VIHTVSPESQLALKSHALFFTDPASGENRECRIAALEECINYNGLRKT